MNADKLDGRSNLPNLKSGSPAPKEDGFAKKAVLIIGSGAASNEANGSLQVKSKDLQAGSALALNQTAQPADREIENRLRQLGYEVETWDDNHLGDYELSGHCMIFISATVAPALIKKLIRDKYSKAETPIIVADPVLFPDMGMTGAKDDDYGVTQVTNKLNIVDSETTLNHPMSARLVGSVIFGPKKVQLSWGKPENTAIPIAEDDNGKVVIFGYECGVFMAGINAPARRVGFFLHEETAADMMPQGWALFDAAVGWATAQRAKPFDRVFRREWKEVQHRRKKQRYVTEDSDSPATGMMARQSSVGLPEQGEINRNKQIPPPEMQSSKQMPQDQEQTEQGRQKAMDIYDLPNHPSQSVMGLALSGGGIRSATFSLGLLQGFNEHGWLRLFDYLSTVSGGGFTGGWWSAWLSRGGALLPDEVLELGGNNTSEPKRQLSNEERDKFLLLLEFKYDELPNPRGFLYRLSLGKTPLAIHLWERFSASLKDKLEGKQPSELDESLLDEAFQEINSWLEEHLYDCRLFQSAGISLTRQTYRLAQTESQKHPQTESQRLRRMQLNRLLLEEAFPEELGRGYFPGHEQIEPQRNDSEEEERAIGEWVNKESADDLLSAGHDPVHHLRLFSNYLTPRRGLLSGDTWRAVSIITRNLALTWIILLPILLGLVLVGQFYFLFWPNPENFLHGLWRWERLKQAAYPLILLQSWLAILTIPWLLLPEKRPWADDTEWWRRLLAIKNWARWLSYGAAFLLLLIVGYAVFKAKGGTGLGPKHLLLLPLLAGGPILWLFFYYQTRDATLRCDKQWKMMLLGNQLTRAHSWLLVVLLVTTLVLAFAGFGPDLMHYLLDDPVKTSVKHYIAKSGGLLAVLMALTGSILTAIKGSPGSGEASKTAKPSLTNHLIFSLTPPLVLIVLTVCFSWATRWLIRSCVTQEISRALIVVTCIGIVLSFYLILSETHWQGRFAFGLLLTIWLFFVGWGGAALANSFHPFGNGLGTLADDKKIVALLASAILLMAYTTGLLVIRLIRTANNKPVALPGRNETAGQTGNERAIGFLRTWGGWILAWLLGIGLILWLLRNNKVDNGLMNRLAPQSLYGEWAFVAFGMVVCLFFAAFLSSREHRETGRARWLLAAIYLLLATLLAVGAMPTVDSRTQYLRAAVGLFGVLFSWVVAIGWTADPNRLSMHLFYRARLVRAYLGASNWRRSETRTDITQAAYADDVLMRDLENCHRGGPYHLINTTLNLVGGRDLATAQRSAAAFVLSKHYCGSSRTGYRDTREYMGGELTLGTAVAISGAAASPNMGSISTTAAQAMLLTLLNVRMGFWAPTPNKDYWQEPQARLWPFLMLREFLSQTNDLASHCYLTDGAHFENMGLYSLVERGCRFIIVSDCGADPKQEFHDLGEAVRRCRIDFGAEIKLDIRPLLKTKERGDVAQRHFVVGTVKYRREHLESLGYKNGILGSKNENAYTGVIVLFKPVLANDEDVDVIQYGMEDRHDFPQQTTGDQFYSEAQFESYRRLGQFSAETFIKTLESNAASVKEACQQLCQGEAIPNKILEDIFNATLNAATGCRNAGVMEKEFD